MKRIALVLIFAFACLAEIPQLINYQGKLTDPDGVAVVGTHSVEFAIYDAETGGTLLWSELHTTVAVSHGLFDVLLGSVTPIDLPFDEQYWIGLTVDSETMTPRQPLTTVPYAQRAMWADSVEGISIISFIDSVTYIDSISFIDSISHIDSISFIDSVTHIDSVSYISFISLIDSITHIDSVEYIAYVSYIDSIAHIDSVHWIDSISYVDFISYIDSVGYIDSIGWIGSTNWADSAHWAGYVHWDSIDGVPDSVYHGGGSGGVTSLNTMTGDLNIIGEGAITVTNADPNIKVGLILDPGDCTGFVDLHDGATPNQNIPVKVQAFNPTVGQFLLTNTEIGCTGGRIRAISFYSSYYGETIEDIDVFMDNVTLSDLHDRNPFFGAEVVTGASVTDTAGDGSYDIELDHGFFYNGGNLLITVQKNGAAGTMFNWNGEATVPVMARYNDTSSDYPLPNEANFAPHVLLDFFPPEIPDVVTSANGLIGDVNWVGSDDIDVTTEDDSTIMIDYIGSAGDNDWEISTAIGDGTYDTTLVTKGQWGLFRTGNVGYGNACSTHVNLGVACTTGSESYGIGYSTVGGGWHNSAGVGSAVGGGIENNANGFCATISGGQMNIASELEATVGGGYGNEASANNATIAGGGSNIASEPHSTVGGGRYNQATGGLSTVCGGYENKSNGAYTFIGGGIINQADGLYSVVTGGYSNSVNGEGSIIGGGVSNIANGYYSVICGGLNNTAMNSSFIGGGGLNTADYWSAILAGSENYTHGEFSVIGGGVADTVNAIYGGVFSGYSNLAGDEESDTAAFVGGGYDNRAVGAYSTICGGKNNSASALFSGVVSGTMNHIDSDTGAFIGGGIGNICASTRSAILGGNANVAYGRLSSISGGGWNTTNGVRSAIPGGSYLTVGDRSFGYRGGIGGDPTTETDVSGEPETFHIVDVHFHHNFNNAAANFLIDGTADSVFYVNATDNTIKLNTVPDDPAPDSVLTIADGILKRAVYGAGTGDCDTCNYSHIADSAHNVFPNAIDSTNIIDLGISWDDLSDEIKDSIRLFSDGGGLSYCGTEIINWDDTSGGVSFTLPDSCDWMAISCDYAHVATFSGLFHRGDPSIVALENRGEVSSISFWITNISWSGTGLSMNLYKEDGTPPFKAVINYLRDSGDGTGACDTCNYADTAGFAFYADSAGAMAWDDISGIPTDISDGDDWGDDTVHTDATLTGRGTDTSPLTIAPQDADSGDVLMWDGTQWIPFNVTDPGLIWESIRDSVYDAISDSCGGSSMMFLDDCEDGVIDTLWDLYNPHGTMLPSEGWTFIEENGYLELIQHKGYGSSNNELQLDYNRNLVGLGKVNILTVLRMPPLTAIDIDNEFHIGSVFSFTELSRSTTNSTDWFVYAALDFRPDSVIGHVITTTPVGIDITEIAQESPSSIYLRWYMRAFCSSPPCNSGARARVYFIANPEEFF